MKSTGTNSLALSGTLLLTLTAQSLLLAPHLQAAVLKPLSGWMIDVIGVAMYLLGTFLLISVLLNYTRQTQLRVFLTTAIVSLLIAWEFQQGNNLVEAATITGLGLAYLLSNWLTVRRGWLEETIQWLNLLIGLGLLIRPNMLLQASEYEAFTQVSAIFGATFILSAIISLIIEYIPALSKGNASHFLAVPWLLWGFMFILPVKMPNLILAFSISCGLLSSFIMPWDKIILRQGAYIGRRFIILVVLAQVFSLALSAWMIRIAEATPISEEALLPLREIALVGYNALVLVSFVVVAWINLAINGMFAGLNGSKNQSRKPAETGLWAQVKSSLLEPFQMSEQLVSEQVRARDEYEALLNRQIAFEKRRLAQLGLVHHLNIELKSVLDNPVSAQLTANAIYSTMGGCLIAILKYDPAQNELVALAVSGPDATHLPPSYTQELTRGLVGRAGRLRRTQLASDTRLDPDYFPLENQSCLSEVAVPILHNNQLRGIIVVDQPEAHAFDDSDIRTLETVAVQLVTAWERSDHDQRLTNLINAGIALSTSLEVDEVIQETVKVALETLEARFVFMALVDKSGGFTRTASAGHAPTLLAMLSSDPDGNNLIQEVLNSQNVVRLRDVRKKYSSTPTGSQELRSLLAAPMRLRQSSIGAILVFGKQGNITFTENDDSLISLLATQAAAAVETTWLYQELRSMLNIATQLHQLSTRVIQAEQLTDAAVSIAETTYQLSKADAAGIVLFTHEKELEAKVQIDSNGLHPGAQHPMELIDQVLDSGQTIITSGRNNTMRICLPLQTPRRQYGALWVEVQERNWNSAHFADNLRTLANQAALALERSLLLVETRRQADEIEDAYHKLEITYDQTLVALSTALDARDRETEGHSLRVARLACVLGRRLGISPELSKTLERGAILHDIGKIGISDTILLKPGPLTADEWETMRLHPDIGARIIEGIPFLQEAMPVIRYHQERWNGTGYPIGLRGNDIPFNARIFAVVDAFDALTNERPYRKPISVEAALAYLKEQSGVMFDPTIVREFEAMSKDGTLQELL